MLYVSDIISRFNGKLLCGDENMILDNFCKDTRIIKNGDIYVGIKGESFDGNNFSNFNVISRCSEIFI